MDIMELVENEMSYRPFQCDWHTCHKACAMPEGSEEFRLMRFCRASSEILTFKDIIVSIRTSDRTPA